MANLRKVRGGRALRVSGKDAMTQEHPYTLHYGGVAMPITEAVAVQISQAVDTAVGADASAVVTILGDSGSVLLLVSPHIPILITGPPGVDIRRLSEECTRR